MDPRQSVLDSFLPNPKSDLQLLFDQAVDQNLPADARSNHFQGLLERCTAGSPDLEELSRLRTVTGDTFAGYAVRQWRNDWVERLKAYKNLCLEVDSRGNNLLHTAAESGSVDSFFSLLEVLGLRARNAEGQTPIHTAIACGQIDILRGLLQRGLIKEDTATIDVGPFSLNLPAYALVVEQLEVYDLFMESNLVRKDQWTARLGNLLHVVAHYGCARSYERICRQDEFRDWGDQLNEAGQTPLHVAASQGQDEFLTHLYERFPRSLEKADIRGRRPIHAAALAFKPACVELIVALGCKPEYFDTALEALQKDVSVDALTMVNFMRNLQPTLDDPQRRQNYHQRPIEYLALAGGGAKGPGEIGVLGETERRLGRKLNVSGTSIGAIIGGLYAVGYTPDELKDNFIAKDFLELIDGVQELKNLKLSELSSSHVLFESAKKLIAISGELREFVAHPVTYGIAKAKAVIDRLVRTTGIFTGRALHEWVEKLIYEKTGVHNLTFGELAERIKKPGSKTCHLFLSITCLEDGSQKLLHPNTVDPEWKDYIVSHMIRASAGYPGVFAPWRIWIKAQDGTPCCVGESQLVDGGMLSNGGTLPLDEVRFSKSKYLDDLEGRRPEFNRGVIAVTFSSPPAKRKPPKTTFTIFDLAKGLLSTYMEAETILNANPYHQTRALKVPVKVGTISFPNKAQKIEMMEDGRKAASAFFDKRTQQLISVQNSVSILSPVYRKLLEAKYSVALTLPQFSGRGSQLRQLAQILVEAPADWKPGQKSKELLLYGSEAMGKSSLAIAFANNHLSDFKLIWAINCHDPELRADSYNRLAQAVGIRLEGGDLAVVHKVHHYLEGLDHPWLLIFDDVKELPERPQKGGSILLISRDKLEDPRLAATVRLGSFELSDVEELIEKRMGIKDRSLAQELCRKFHSDPELIDQAVRRIAEFSGTPEDYLRTLQPLPSESSVEYLDMVEEPFELEAGLLELRDRSPAAYESLELLAYLAEAPQSFLEDYVVQHAPLSFADVRKSLLDADRIRPHKEGSPVAIRSGIAKKIEEAHQKKGLGAAKFNAAFEALEAWATQDRLKRGEACAHSRTHAMQKTAPLWNQSPAALRSSICRIAGNWYLAENVPLTAIELLDQALVLSPDEAVKKEIIFELQLAKIHEKNERLPALISFAIYLPHIPLAFLPFWLEVPAGQAYRIFKQLAFDSLVRNSKKFLELKTEPRQALLRISEGLQQGKFNEALAAFTRWISLDTFDLQASGEGCVACINHLSRDDDELMLLWRRTPAEFRVEMYVRSAQYLSRYGESPEKAMTAYDDALEICTDARRRGEISSEKAALAQKLADLARAAAPPPVRVGFLERIFGKK